MIHRQSHAPEAPCERIAALRRARGETLEQFGAAIGVGSKGRVSELERGLRPCTAEQALAIERLSAGAIDASELNPLIASARIPVAGQEAA